MNSKNYLKSFLKLNAINNKQLAEKMTFATGKKYTQGSITGKINRNSISFDEVSMIAELFGYKLEFVKKNN